jgi:hypothetical protein
VIEGYTNGIPNGLWRMATLLSLAAAATLSGFFIGWAWPMYRPLWSALLAVLMAILGVTMVMWGFGVLG